MRLAISTTETLTDLKTDLVVANNNNNITEMVNITDISQHAVLSAHKINHIYFSISVNVPSVFFIVNCTNLT